MLGYNVVISNDIDACVLPCKREYALQAVRNPVNNPTVQPCNRNVHVAQ